MDKENESVTNCHSLKLEAEDGKHRVTNIVDDEQWIYNKIRSIQGLK